jgi:hypothetical protein
MTAVFGEGVVYDSDPKKRNTQMQRTAAALKSSRLKTYVEKIIKASRSKPATVAPECRARAEQCGLCAVT